MFKDSHISSVWDIWDLHGDQGIWGGNGSEAVSMAMTRAVEMAVAAAMEVIAYGSLALSMLPSPVGIEVLVLPIATEPSKQMYTLQSRLLLAVS